MYKCPNCDAVTKAKIDGASYTVYCDNCHWAATTSLFAVMSDDKIIYKLDVNKLNYREIKDLDLIGEIAGVNKLGARKIIQEGGGKFEVSGNALEMTKLLNIVKRYAVFYSIDPPFPWSN